MAAPIQTSTVMQECHGSPSSGVYSIKITTRPYRMPRDKREAVAMIVRKAVADMNAVMSMINATGDINVEAFFESSAVGIRRLDPGSSDDNGDE